MFRDALSFLSSNPSRKTWASGSGAEKGPQADQAAQAASQGGASASGPALQRSNSLPARLPSQPLEPAEVKTARKSITRPSPDTRSREGFYSPHLEGGMREGARRKRDYLGWVLGKSNNTYELVAKIERSEEYMQLIESLHPRYRQYGKDQKIKACYELTFSHPQLRAEAAEKRNASFGIPNYPASSRVMEPYEQKFLAKAIRRIQRDVEKRPFHIHGESGVVGDANGDITWFGHSPAKAVTISSGIGDKYTLHTHPPFAEPFTSSASEPDHRLAASTYYEDNRKMNQYVTNGKDVLHIHPANLELIKLIPDPEGEEKMGKFPEAFRVPEPQKPPRPFANHEAPAAFRGGWEKPSTLMKWFRQTKTALEKSLARDVD